MKWPLFVILLVSATVQARAGEDPRSGALQVGSDKVIDLSGYLSLYEQGSRPVSPALAFQFFEAGKFQPFPAFRSEYLNWGLTPREGWLALKLQNRTNTEAAVVLEYILSGVNTVQCYTVNTAQAIRLLAVENGADRQSGLLARTRDFNVNLRPLDEVLLLMHVTNRGQLLYIPGNLYSLDYFDNFDADRHNFFGIFQGIFFFIILFNILLFVTTRDKVYGLYLLYAFFISVFALNEVGVAVYDLSFLPFLDSFSSQTYLFAGFAVWLLLMLQFLNVPRQGSPLRVATIGFVALDLALAAYPFRPALSVCFAANLGFIIVANALRIVKGNRLALSYAIANVPVVLGALVYYANSYGLTDIRFGPLNPIALGLSLETFLISFGFAYRFNFFAAEKRALLVHLNQQQREHTGEILQAQELERKRIAEDLHDELGGNLAAIKMAVEALPAKDGNTQWLSMLIDRTSDKARTIAHNLMPPEFDNTRLVDLLSDQWRQTGGTPISFHHSGAGDQFSKQDELVIYRITMELVNNSLRHARASAIVLQLVYYEDHLLLMVEDDGVGLTDSRGGMGLRNVRSRIGYMGGTIAIDSGTGGTTISIQVPYTPLTWRK